MRAVDATLRGRPVCRGSRRAIPFDQLVRACVPFYSVIGAAPALIIAFPSLVAFLPSMIPSL